MNRKISPKKYIVTAARKLSIYKTYVTEGIFETGLGHALVVREKKNGEKVMGMYLLDVYCLGLKDTSFNIFSTFEYEEFMRQFRESSPNNFMEHEPSYVFNLIYGAIEYAEDLGFDPHSDFKVTEYILDDVREIDYIDLKFGVDGKPFYIAGPFDKKNKILNTLINTVGEDGFEYVDEADMGPEESSVNALEILPNDSDYESYEGYAELTYELFDMIAADMDQMLYQFVNEPKRIIERAKAKLYEAEYPKEELEDEGLDFLIMSVLEKLFIFRRPGFIDEFDFIESFDNREEAMTDFKLLNKVILNSHGVVKLRALFTLLITSADIETINMSATEWISRYLEYTEEEIVKMENHLFAIVLFHILHHSETFGAIDFDQLDLEQTMKEFRESQEAEKGN